MATISENLQTIKNSTDAIKQAIIDKGGTIEGDITTWADAINGISGGGSEGGAGSVGEFENTFRGSAETNMLYYDIYGELDKPFEENGKVIAIGKYNNQYITGTSSLLYANMDTSIDLSISPDEPFVGDIPFMLLFINESFTNIKRINVVLS